MIDRSPVVVSYGMGVDSTGAIVEMVRRKDPIDLILAADTGGEQPRTYVFRDLFSEWLTSKGYPPVVTVRHYRDNGAPETLEEECLRIEAVPSLAYGYKKCSQKYKRRPQERYVNHWAPARAAWKRGMPVTKIVGYDIDERHRAAQEVSEWTSFYVTARRGETTTDIAMRFRTTERELRAWNAKGIARRPWPSVFDEDRKIRIRVRKYFWRYPLIEWKWGREECVEAITDAGLPVPGKSSCFFCPASRVPEILALPTDLLARAIAIEDNARPHLETVKGLGRRFSWRELVESKGLLDIPEPPEQTCGCYDGD